MKEIQSIKNKNVNCKCTLNDHEQRCLTLFCYLLQMILVLVESWITVLGSIQDARYHDSVRLSITIKILTSVELTDNGRCLDNFLAIYLQLRFFIPIPFFVLFLPPFFYFPFYICSYKSISLLVLNPFPPLLPSPGE